MMTRERWNALEGSNSLPLTPLEVRQGYHWCNDWDGLLIGPDMGEWEFCLCFEDDLKKQLELNAS